METSDLPTELTNRIDALTDACRQWHVHRLDIFGSVAKDAASDISDIDFVVEFESMAPVEYASAYFGLLHDLETLFGRQPDLVEAQTLTNPVFRAAVEASRRNIYAA